MTDYIKAPDQPVETDLTMTEDSDGRGLIVKHFFIKKEGTHLPQHSHSHDHVTVVAHGGISVWKNGEHWRSILAPASFVIQAGIKHAFRTSLPNTVLLCIHRSDVEMVEDHQIV